jgi:hypothetical protein
MNRVLLLLPTGQRLQSLVIRLRTSERKSPMKTLSPRRLVPLIVTLAMLTIPTLIALLTAAPSCGACI